MDRDIQILTPSEVAAEEDKNLTRLLDSSLESGNVNERIMSS